MGRLGNALTKKRLESRTGLQRFLQTWLCVINYDPTFTAAKKNKKTGKKALARIDAHSNQAKPESFGLPVQHVHRPVM